MNENNLPRTYNFPPELLAEWKRFHGSSTKDYSVSASAAFLLYMVVEPSVREELRRLAISEDMKKARIEARKVLRKAIVDAYIAGFVFSEEDRAILLQFAEQLRAGLSRKG